MWQENTTAWCRYIRWYYNYLACRVLCPSVDPFAPKRLKYSFHFFLKPHYVLVIYYAMCQKFIPTRPFYTNLQSRDYFTKYFTLGRQKPAEFGKLCAWPSCFEARGKKIRSFYGLQANFYFGEENKPQIFARTSYSSRFLVSFRLVS